MIHKPFRVLSQFSREGEKTTLKDVFDVPSDVYPVGRLDYDSEGLLILTNDKGLNQKLLHPTQKHEREYWVQVEGAITGEAIDTLQKGVTIRIAGKDWKTEPCRATVFGKPPDIGERHPPIRYRQNIPTSWVRMVLHEGKNRQVRRMTAAVGFPTLRLVRARIEGMRLQPLKSGEMRRLERNEIYKILNIRS